MIFTVIMMMVVVMMMMVLIVFLFKNWSGVLDESVVFLFLVLFFVATATGRAQSPHQRLLILLRPVMADLVALAKDALITDVTLEIVIVDVIIALEHGDLDRSRHRRREFVANHEKTRQSLVFHDRALKKGTETRYARFLSSSESPLFLDKERYFGFCDVPKRSIPVKILM